MLQTKIIGDDIALLFVVEIEEFFAVCERLPQPVHAAIIVTGQGALCIQCPGNIDRSEVLVLPHMHHFVDKMRCLQRPPRVDDIKTNIRKVEPPAADTGLFVYFNPLIINAFSKNSLGQCNLLGCEPPGIGFANTVHSYQECRNAQPVGNGKQPLQHTPRKVSRVG